jgi:hypothetical protein
MHTWRMMQCHWHVAMLLHKVPPSIEWFDTRISSITNDSMCGSECQSEWCPGVKDFYCETEGNPHTINKTVIWKPPSGKVFNQPHHRSCQSHIAHQHSIYYTPGIIQDVITTKPSIRDGYIPHHMKYSLNTQESLPSEMNTSPVAWNIHQKDNSAITNVSLTLPIFKVKVTMRSNMLSHHLCYPSEYCATTIGQASINNKGTSGKNVI